MIATSDLLLSPFNVVYITVNTPYLIDKQALLGRVPGDQESVSCTSSLETTTEGLQHFALHHIYALIDISTGHSNHWCLWLRAL
jgi:hypothetical protein